jgi:hypothetical protein
MLVVDIMHEFELGVWKALFIHLLRILESVDKALIHELDRRYDDCYSSCCLYKSDASITLLASGWYHLSAKTPSGVFPQIFQN